MIENKRLYNLDVLKVFAAVFIVFHHYQQVSGTSFDGINFYGGRISWGLLVELFFVISGFLTAMTIKSNDSIGKSIVRRVARILPLAFLAVLFNYIISILYHCTTGKLLFGESYSFMQVVTSLLLLNQGWVIEFFPAINNPTWYLCVLMWVTILYTLIKHMVNKNIRFEIIVSLSFVALGIVGWRMYFKYDFVFPFLHGSDFRGYATFFMGVCLYHMYTTISETKALFVSVGLLLLSVIGMAFLGVSNWFVLVALFFPGIVLLAVSLPQIKIPKISFFWGGIIRSISLAHAHILFD